MTLKKWIVASAVAIGVTAGAIGIVGFTFQPNTYHYHAQSNKSFIAQTLAGPMMAHTKTLLRTSATGLASAHMDATLTFNSNIAQATPIIGGSGQVQLATTVLAFQLADSHLRVLKTTAGPIYYGPISGTIKLSAGEVLPVILGVAIQPSTGKSQFGLTIGTLPNEAVLQFGTPFVTIPEARAMGVPLPPTTK